VGEFARTKELRDFFIDAFEFTRDKHVHSDSPLTSYPDLTTLINAGAPRRGLRYGPVSWNSKAGSVIDLLVELDAHGVIGCVRPVGTPLSTRPVKNISGAVYGNLPIKQLML